MWVQAVCKGYQQRTMLAASKERAKRLLRANALINVHTKHFDGLIGFIYYHKPTSTATEASLTLEFSEVQSDSKVNCAV